MKATGNGTATITAKATDGSGKSASCRVNGTVLVEQITIYPNPISLYVNWEQTTYCEVFPWKARNKAVSWASNNSGIASVDQYGTISGNAPGWCYITATAKDGSKVSDSVLVDVSVKSLERVTLNKYSMQLNVGKSETLIGTYSPADASYTWFSWVSDNTSVAVVDSNGKVTGKSAGTANISLVFAEITVTCQVTVKANPSSGGGGNSGGGNNNGGNNGGNNNNGNDNPRNSGAVSYITIPPSKEMFTGDKSTILATVNPRSSSSKITWSSSNKNIATVNSKGQVTAKKEGTVKITAKAGGMSATCTVNVSVLPVYNEAGDYGGNQAGPMIAFEDEDDKIRNIVQKYYPELNTTEKISNFLDELNHEGCGYVALTNTIFIHFQKDPEGFERKFGYPMYSQDSSGKAHYNFSYILIDLYCATDVKAWNFLWFEFENGTTSDSIKSRFEEYMSLYNIPVEVKNRDDSGGTIHATVENYNRYKGEGQILMSCYPVRMYYSDWTYIDIEAGHAMTVTGVESGSHLKVSSWEKLCYFTIDDYNDLRAFFNPPAFQVIIYK